MQAEPRAALSLASREASPLLRLSKSDLLLYSAKVSNTPACPCVCFSGSEQIRPPSVLSSGVCFAGPEHILSPAVLSKGEQ